MKAFPFFRTLCFIALICLGPAPGPAAATDPVKEADELLNSPSLDLPQALCALDLYTEILKQAKPPQTPILIRLARTCFLIGELTVASQRQKYYEKGQTFAEMLLKEEPTRVEGRYWLAMHLCGQADTGGVMQGRKLLPRIMEELERARAIDETYDQAGCHRVLGRIYFEAPAWPFSVGDLEKSLQLLTAAVRLAPENSTNNLYLAETLLKLNRQAQARQVLERVLQCSKHALLPRGLEEDRKEARRLLERLTSPPEGQ
ncbi:MAG: tetratricopeptide repeat protein [Deltaproteobacteria bacterium]|nr:tetratricopeptide repeat protein [Deltaproteobacteria bacterium]